MRTAALFLPALLSLGCASLLGIEDGKQAASGGTAAVGGDASGAGGSDGAGASGGSGGTGTGGESNVECMPPQLPPNGCASLDRLSDEFAGAVLHQQWLQQGTGSITFPAGTSSMTTSAAEMASMTTYRAYDTRNASVSIDLGVVNLGGLGSLSLELESPDPDGGRVAWTLSPADLFLTTDDGGGGTQVPFNTTFMPVEHDQWRFRRTGDLLLAQTAQEGAATFITHHQLNVSDYFPSGFASVNVTLNGSSAPSSATIESVSGAPPQPNPWCPLSTLTGDFTSNEWSRRSSIGSFSVSAAASSLGLELHGTTPEFASVLTAPAYALFDDMFVVRLTQTELSAGAYATVFFSQGVRTIELRIYEDQLVFWDGAQQSFAMHSIAAIPLLRIRIAAGRYSVDTSTDGLVWEADVVDYSPPNPFEAGVVGLRLDKVDPQLAGVVFSDVNCAFGR